MCFYEKQTPLQYLHVILYLFCPFLFCFYGYTSVDQFLLKDCGKSTFFTGLPLKGTDAGKALWHCEENGNANIWQSGAVREREITIYRKGQNRRNRVNLHTNTSLRGIFGTSIFLVKYAHQVLDLLTIELGGNIYFMIIFSLAE